MLAAVICSITTLTSFGILLRVGRSREPMRTVWLLIAGVCASAGIWATHFVAMLAYQANIPVTYDLGLTAASLMIAALAAVGAFALCSKGDVFSTVVGGAILGLGISCMHFTGMHSLAIAGHLEWDLNYAAAAVILGVVLSVLAMLSFRAVRRKLSVVAGAVVLTAAICAMHFTAMAAAVVVPDPTVVPHAGIEGDASSLAIAVAAITALVILTGLLAIFIDYRASLESRERVRELVDAASEGILICANRKIINANRRFCELADMDLEDIEGRYVDGDLFQGLDFEDQNANTVEALLRTRDHHLVPVEVVRRPITKGLRGNEVYAVHDLTERRRNEATIAHMAHHDALTDLPNRTLLRERLKSALAHDEPDQQVALLCLDLDRFKAVNDTFGHPVGDALLRKVARRLLGCVRECDTVARIGGDEFLIIQRSSDPLRQSAELAEQVIAALSAAYVVRGNHLTIGASVGIIVPAHGEDLDIDTLIARADTALYSAKDRRRGSFTFYDEEMSKQADDRRELERDLGSPALLDQLVLHYQSIFCVESNRIIGAEALVRWLHPQRGLTPPNVFISLAEETGTIISIGEWVLREACREASRWPDDIKIAINLSPVQIRTNTLVETVREAITAAGIAPERVELEITESVLLQDSDQTLGVLQQLRDLGLRICMDDFGTGYSSLSYLQKFAFDKIKIDRCFVRDTKGGLAVVRAICGLGHALGLKVLVEGIETPEQALLALREGCAEMQGYYFSPPVDAATIGEMLGSGQIADSDAKADACAAA